MKKSTILKKIDKMDNGIEKLEYLNQLFLKAKTEQEERMILDMIEQLKFFGK